MIYNRPFPPPGKTRINTYCLWGTCWKLATHFQVTVPFIFEYYSLKYSLYLATEFIIYLSTYLTIWKTIHLSFPVFKRLLFLNTSKVNSYKWSASVTYFIRHGENSPWHYFMYILTIWGNMNGDTIFCEHVSVLIVLGYFSSLFMIYLGGSIYFLCLHDKHHAHNWS